MYKKHKLIRLETNKKADHNSIIEFKNKLLTNFMTGAEARKLVASKAKQYNLYLLSDEKIVENDYWINLNWVENGKYSKPFTGSNTFNKCKEFTPFNNEIWLNCDDELVKNTYKIVATTDTSLNLPTFSQEFIKEYCDAGGINEIEVKYTNVLTNEEILEGLGKSYNDYKYRLKLRDNNTIITKPVKNYFNILIEPK